MKERIVIDPEIQHGKPVIRGTWVPITRIFFHPQFVGGLSEARRSHIPDAW